MGNTLRDQLDAAIPSQLVVEAAQQFLQGCGWRLEVDDEVLQIPVDVAIVVCTRAFVAAETNGTLLDDHFEATVFIGVANHDPLLAAYAQLRMYFNLDGEFVTEDRYSPTAG